MILTVLHTNDYHDKLTDKRAERIASLLRSSGPDTLLLDAGDAVSAGNVGVRIGGEPILTLMSRIGYHAMALGNREFHVADTVLRHKIGNASFPVLSANMRYRDDRGHEMPTTPAVVLTTSGGIRTGVIGVTVPMVTERMAARCLSAFLFDDPVDAIGRTIEALRDRTDALIVLSHAGYKADLKIAETFPDLALVVGGHSHAVLEHADLSAGAPVVQAGSHGRFLGRTTLRRSWDGIWTVARSELIVLPR